MAYVSNCPSEGELNWGASANGSDRLKATTQHLATNLREPTTPEMRPTRVEHFLPQWPKARKLDAVHTKPARAKKTHHLLVAVVPCPVAETKRRSAHHELAQLRPKLLRQERYEVLPQAASRGARQHVRSRVSAPTPPAPTLIETATTVGSGFKGRLCCRRPRRHIHSSPPSPSHSSTRLASVPSDVCCFPTYVCKPRYRVPAILQYFL